jgi:protein-tyrosine phosphatase
VTDLDRHVNFEACFNFRDLGGYETADGARLRWNTLYRSDTLHRFTPSDAGTFRALGVRTVVDLRSQREIDDYGRIQVADGDFAWHNLPMLDDVKLAPAPRSDPVTDPTPPDPPPPPGERYYMILQEFRQSVARVFSILAAEDALPAVYHCTAGKDRTGIVSALILDSLGVPDETIARDYLLTDAGRERSSAWIEINEPQLAAFLAQIPPERRLARPENILAMLELVRSDHGSVRGLLNGFGVSNDQLDRMRKRLLEPRRGAQVSGSSGSGRPSGRG